MNRTHELKTLPEPFTAVLEGRKRYEIRVNDRDFKVGDELHLAEWDPGPLKFPTRPQGYTGRECTVRVTYMTPGGQWGLPANVCVMSLEAATRLETGGRK